MTNDGEGDGSRGFYFFPLRGEGVLAHQLLNPSVRQWTFLVPRRKSFESRNSNTVGERVLNHLTHLWWKALLPFTCRRHYDNVLVVWHNSVRSLRATRSGPLNATLAAQMVLT